MFDSFIFHLDGWVIVTLTLLFYLLCLEIGFYWGKWTRESKSSVLRTQMTTIQASVLGLLALILGFTFSMSIARFETRKHLLVDESNSIRKTYLFTELFDDPYRSNLQSLLKKYVDNRMAFINIGLDEQKINSALQESAKLQQQIWDAGLSTTSLENRELRTSILLQSINQMIDLHTTRLDAMINRLPDTILYLICLIAGLGLCLTGYISGLDRTRNVVATTILATLFSVITLIIIDLDRPDRGFIRESYTSLINLGHTLNQTQHNTLNHKFD